MSVLLISRGSMSGGQIIAQSLAHTAGFRCVTREDLIASVNRHGEIANRVTASIGKAARAYDSFSELRRPYKILMRLALLEYARQDNLAYFGYSGHLLVEGIAHFVRVRLLAPQDLRVRTTMARLRCTEEEAQDYIREVDEERSRWTRFMYGKNLCDPRLYDLCVNMDRISFSTVCSLLMHSVREAEFLPSVESLAELEDRYIGARIEATLVLDQRTYGFEVGANVRSGEVLLVGPYLDDPERSLVIQIASTIPGVGRVDYQPGYAPNLEFLP
ncbi:MAG: cytidylate kinase family protein [Acidobacteriota bacterium]